MNDDDLRESRAALLLIAAAVASVMAFGLLTLVWQWP